MEEKKAKEKVWFSKMNGFFSSKTMSEIEKNEQEEKLLKEKLNRQIFGQDSTNNY